MKAAYIRSYGREQKLTVGELPDPQGGDSDLLIRIKAASVNPIDFKIRNGNLRLLRKYQFPLILGHDFSGEVVGVGQSVSKFKLGDWVYCRPRNAAIGSFAEMIAVNEADVSLMPSNLSFEEAASIPLVALTTWQAFELAKVRAGQKIYIPAGSGGVGSFAIQLARERGAEVWTSCGSQNISLVKKLGAHHALDYRVQDPLTQLKDLDFVFDTLGGESLDKSFSVVKKGGMIISIAGSPTYHLAKDMNLNPAYALLFGLVGFKCSIKSLLSGVSYRFLFMKASGEQLNEIRKMIEAKKIIPIVDRIFPLESAQEAIAYSESGRARGKIIVKI